MFARRTAASVLDDTPLRVICSSETGVPFSSDFQIHQYLAVSYYWHSDEWPPPPDDRSGAGIGRPKDKVARPWPIFKRFAEAIMRERCHPREGIWMYQLCINQSDEAEKQQAIAAINLIYKSCWKLVVLLEDVELIEDEIRISVKYDLYANKDLIPLDNADVPAFLSFLDTVGQARWWQRTWY